MPACPFCQTEIPDDFGLIDCPSCRASLFVDMDGSVEASAPPAQAGAQSLQPEEPDEEFGKTFAAQLIDESLQGEESVEAPAQEEAAFADFGEKPVEFNSFEEMGAEEPPAIPVESESEEPLEDFSADEPLNESFESAPKGPDQPLQVPPPMKHQNHGEMDLSNMATAMDQEGVSEGLRYDLEITGIDTADLRREVMESLMDKKLGWNVEELMQRINAGSLTLKGLSAVKAHVVVQRLKTLPLDMRWDQHADS